jgi:predicted nucleic acid-binding protein
MKRVFIDTNILLDVALERQPFYTASKAILTLAEQGKIKGFTTSLSIANGYYILRKAGGDANARSYLSALVTFLTVLPVDHSDIVEALGSAWNDFEDALQHCAALKQNCDCIITRNGADYTNALIPVYDPSTPHLIEKLLPTEK